MRTGLVAVTCGGEAPMRGGHSHEVRTGRRVLGATCCGVAPMGGRHSLSSEVSTGLGGLVLRVTCVGEALGGHRPEVSCVGAEQAR